VVVIVVDVLGIVVDDAVFMASEVVEKKPESI